LFFNSIFIIEALVVNEEIFVKEFLSIEKLQFFSLFKSTKSILININNKFIFFYPQIILIKIMKTIFQFIQNNKRKLFIVGTSIVIVGFGYSLYKQYKEGNKKEQINFNENEIIKIGKKNIY
jgi:hypothetical protein